MMIDDLRYWLNPATWVRNKRTGKELDTWINDLASNNTFEPCGPCTVKLGEHIIWIANYPYDCFTPYSRGIPDILKDELGMPSRKTVLKLRKKLVNDLLLRK